MPFIQDEIRKMVKDAIQLRSEKGPLEDADLLNLAEKRLNASLLRSLHSKSYNKSQSDDGILSVSLAYQGSEEENAQAVGFLDPLNSDERVAANTCYSIASISKFVLMIMTLRLVQRGQLKLTDPVPLSAYVSEQERAQLDPISLADLLGHRSGLKDQAFMSFKKGEDLAKLIKRNDQGLVLAGKPGENFYYANVNYVLVATVIENVMKMSLGRCLKELILTPLDLHGLYVIDDCEPISYKQAKGYNADTSAQALQDASDFSIFGSAGFHASPLALAKLMRHFFKDYFIQPQYRELVLKSIKDEIFEVITPENTYRWPAQVGLGLDAMQMADSDGKERTVYYHGGWQDSHACFVVYDPLTDHAYACGASKTFGLPRIHQNTLRLALAQSQMSSPNMPEVKEAVSWPVMGLGCVDLRPENSAIIDYALQRGIATFDTAECYGNGQSEVALGQKLKTYPREKLFIASKGGVRFENGLQLSGEPQSIRSACLASLNRLEMDYIDLYYLHRVDPKTAIEKSMRALSQLVKEGKIKYIGLSEVTEKQLRRAHKVHPITAVQIEYAPWSRVDETNGLIAACQSLGIAVVAYSPLGRAFFTSAGPDFFNGLPPSDIRKFLPRYNGSELEQNMGLRSQLEKLAQSKGCTLAQLVLAWELKKGLKVIPATIQQQHLDENIEALLVDFNEAEISQMEDLLASMTFVGPRYPSQAFSAIYPEEEAAAKRSLLTPRNVLLGLSFVTTLGGLFAYGYSRRNANNTVLANPSVSVLPQPGGK